MRTGFVWHERYFWFDTGGVLPALAGCEPYPHWDTPNSRRRIKNFGAKSNAWRSTVKAG